ncbi:MAG TPA: hemerythrin domain-containing protein [Candidatus Eisenbacteria bacterium]|nr:hemerythrin domain-containing protein [Candidatus Eisenbacteria bacterium]
MPNATQLIRQDHKKVEGLFKKFQQTKSAASKRRIAEQAMQELEVHAAIEEEIFYPAVEREIGDRDLIRDSQQEHQTVKNLIQELKGMNGQGEQFEEKFSELQQNVEHHVKEEEGELLPKAEESELDLAALGRELGERKRELMRDAPPSAKAKTKSKPRPKPKTKSRSARRSTRARRSSVARRAR